MTKIDLNWKLKNLDGTEMQRDEDGCHAGRLMAGLLSRQTEAKSPIKNLLWATQLYKKEVTGLDFLYFINNIISSLPRRWSYTILTDNASWHHAGVVQGLSSNKFLYFNEPRMFQLNIIENAFSFIRSEFRRRPFVETLEEEAVQIINLFFEETNVQRFTGLLRNHLRQLIKYHK